MFGRGHGPRIQKLEDRFTAMDERVEGVVQQLGGIDSKIDQLIGDMSSSGDRAAQRAQAVKIEIGEESQRKAREKSELFKNGLALMGGIALIVTALVGPYRERLDTTAQGQQADTAAIAAVREVLAQQGAEEGRLQASQEIQRDTGVRRDTQLREHGEDLAYTKGIMAAKGWPAK